MGRFLTVLILSAAICGVIACQFGLIDFSKTKRGGDGGDPLNGSVAAAHPELGDGLYASKPLDQPLMNPERHGPEPLAIGGNLSAVDKMDAAPQVPGQILFIGQEIPEGVAQVGGAAALLQGKIQAALVDVGDSKHYKLYRRLSEGDIIGKDEMVGLVNPAKAIHAVREKLTKLAAAEEEESSTAKIHQEAERRLAVDRRLFEQKVIAEKEYSDSKLTTIKTWGDYVSKQAAAKVAAIDVIKEKLSLSQHYIHNKLPVSSSIIKTIYKRTGEAVKELEPVVHLYAVDQLTAEGLVELQFSNRLKLGKKVYVEPTQDTSPMRVWRAHKKEITAVAVAHLKDAQDKLEPVAASASEDGTVCLWSERFAGPIGLFACPAPVRSLACTPDPKAQRNLLVAGLSDGSIYVWDLGAYVFGDQIKLLKPSEPLKPKILRSPHGDSVTALAFSPDGRFFASGSTDGSITMWDSTLPEYLLYPFDSQHGVNSPHTAPITALHFTPQTRLVSAARDNTLRIWKLFQRGAELAVDPIAGRSGSVAALGVSRNGSTILFDQGKTLQFLSPDGRTIATLQNPAGTIPFETLAEFSPDAKLLLTAGASEGRLQLWKAPTDGKRGFELRQLVTSERSNATSAAFFDANATGEIPFAVSGTKDGIVYLWPLPTSHDVQRHRIDDVELTQISNNVETRQVRIGVQVPNDGRLIPGQPVTIVIE